MATTKFRNGMTVGTMLRLVFVVLAVSFAASLTVQFTQARSELSNARRAASLAAADAAIFQATQTLRSSRGKVQTIVVTGDQADIKTLLARNEAQLKTVYDVVDTAGVSQAANETGSAASDVLGAAGQVSRQSENLAKEVSQFIAGVRVA
jgi:methyl-accepting chemotaxis protein